MEFLKRAESRHCFILARDKKKKDQKNLQRKLVDYCPKQGHHKQRTDKHRDKQSGSNSPVTSKHVFPKRSAKMIDWTGKRDTTNLAVILCQKGNASWPILGRHPWGSILVLWAVTSSERPLNLPILGLRLRKVRLNKEFKKKEEKKIQIFLWIEFKELVIIRISYKLMRSTPVLTG